MKLINHCIDRKACLLRRFACQILSILLCTASGFASAQLAPSAWPKALGNAQNTSLSPGFGTVPIIKWINAAAIGYPIIGPDGSVYSVLTNATAVNGQSGNIIWSVPFFAFGGMSPALGANGSLYASLSETEEGGGFGDLTAISSTSGALLWSGKAWSDIGVTIGKDGSIFSRWGAYLFSSRPVTGILNWTSQSGGGPLFLPAIGRDGTIYEVCDDGNVYALNPTTGGVEWTFTPGINKYAFEEFVSQVMVGSDGTLFFATDSTAGDLVIFAVDGSSGKQLWQTDLGPFNANNGGPFEGFCLGPGDQVIMVYQDTTGQSWLTSLEGKTGVQSWTVSSPSALGLISGGDGTIYEGSFNVNSCSVTALSGLNGSQLWTYTTPNNVQFLAVNDGVAGGESLSMGADGLMYFSTNAGLYCLDSIHVTAISVNPTSVLGGTGATGTVTINYPAPTGGATVLLTSSSAYVTVPTSITVPAGKTSTTFAVTTLPVDNQMVGTISAAPGISQTATITVNPAAPSGLSLSPLSVQGGSISTGTVTLGSPAGPSGVAITLASSNSAASVPATVTVPSGQTSATFTVTTSGVNANTTSTITASYGSNQFNQTLTITPASLSIFTLNPPSVLGGASSTGTITLTGPAGTSGTIISLASSSASATVPASVTVPAGKVTASFTVSTTPVGTQTSAVITATLNNQPLTATLTITPATLVSVSLNPTSVLGGSPSTGTVTLSGAAPTGGTSVALSIGNSSATVPSSVTVAAGQTTATFTVSTTGVNAPTSAVISATLNNKPQTATLAITPAALSSLSLSPTSVQGGTPSTGTVTLIGPAGAGGTTIVLSSNTPVATLPTSVTIPSGQTSATFKVTTFGVNAQTTAIISGSRNGTSATSNLTITSVGLQSFTVSPTTVFGGNSSTGTIILNGPAGIGGSTVTLGSSSSSVTPPGSVTIAQGQTSITFQIQTSAVTSTVAATVTAN